MNINDIKLQGKDGDIFRVVTLNSLYTYDLMMFVENPYKNDYSNFLLIYNALTNEYKYTYNTYGFSTFKYLEFQYLGSGDLINCINTF